MEASITTSLQGKRGLVVGTANDGSIATGCARAFVAAGASLAATCLNEKALAHVRAVTDRLGCKLLLACDVRVPGQLEAIFEHIRPQWGRLDFAISPAPIRTRAASGIDRFDDLLATAAAPEHPLLDIDAVGAPARVAGQRPRAASPAAASPSMAAGT